MPSSYTKILINGVEPASRVRPTRLTWTTDGPDSFDFSEGPGCFPIPVYSQNLPVVVSLDRANLDAVVFRGRIVGVDSSKSETGWTHGYRCLGKQFDLDQIPVRPATGAIYRFNLPKSDPDYSPSRSGLTVGQMLAIVLADHSAAMSAVGVTFASGFLDGLTWTPPRPVDFGGERLWSELVDFLGRWAMNHRFWLDYSSGCQIKVFDLGSLATERTVALGTDKAELVSFRTGTENCFTRVVGLGGDEVELHELRLSDATLQEDWTSTQETNWVYGDFKAEGIATDGGNVISMTQSVVTVQSSSNTRTWAANFWAGTREGRLQLRGTPVAGVTSQAIRDVSANTALTAGGQATVTVSRDFELNSYTKYSLFGRKDNDHVWRRYLPTDTAVRTKLRRLFAKPVTYRFAEGQAAITGISHPLGFIKHAGILYQMLVTIDQATGQILFVEPVVAHTALGNSEADLDDGDVTTEPADVVVAVPVAVRRLETSFPPNSGGSPVYSGLAATEYGIQRTKYIRLDEWEDKNAQSQIERLLEEVHKSVRDPRVEARVAVHGYTAAAYRGLGWALRLQARRSSGSDLIDLGLLSDLPLPVRSVSVEWGRGDGMLIQIETSNERKPSTSLDFYTHGISGSSIHNNFLSFESLPQEGFALGDGGDFSELDATVARLSDLLLPRAGVNAEEARSAMDASFEHWRNWGEYGAAYGPRKPPKPEKRELTEQEAKNIVEGLAAKIPDPIKTFGAAIWEALSRVPK